MPQSYAVRSHSIGARVSPMHSASDCVEFRGHPTYLRRPGLEPGIWTTDGRVHSSSRTIADLDGADLIDTPYIAEALQYRKREGD